MATRGRYDVIIRKILPNENIYDTTLKYGASKMILTNLKIWEVDTFFSKFDNEYQYINKLREDRKIDFERGKIFIVDTNGYNVASLFGNKTIKIAVANLYDGRDNFGREVKKVKLNNETKAIIDEFTRIVSSDDDEKLRESIALSCMTRTLYNNMVEYCKLRSLDWLEPYQVARMDYLEKHVDLYVYMTFRKIVNFIERYKNRNYYKRTVNTYRQKSQSKVNVKINNNQSYTKEENNNEKLNNPIVGVRKYNIEAEEKTGHEEFLDAEEFENMFGDEIEYKSAKTKRL